MARPTTQLISRVDAVRAALEIIDTVGLDTFSLSRLARHLGVRAPSLYYHFSDRSEILRCVAAQVTETGHIPIPSPGPDWPDHFVDVCLATRVSVLRHRNTAPLLLQYLPPGRLIGGYEQGVRYLAASAVSPRLHVRILYGLERIMVGAVLVEALRPSREAFTVVVPDAQPHLARALSTNTHDAETIFEQHLRAFVAGIHVSAATSAEAAAGPEV